jgi:hypothetical protein
MNALLLSEYLTNHANVTPFMSSLGTMTNVLIASVAVAYDCPLPYSTYIRIFQQVLYKNDLQHALYKPQSITT